MINIDNTFWQHRLSNTCSKYLAIVGKNIFSWVLEYNCLNRPPCIGQYRSEKIRIELPVGGTAYRQSCSICKEKLLIYHLYSYIQKQIYDILVFVKPYS